MTERARLIDVSLDEASLPRASHEAEQERRVAVFDLLEGNSFALTLPEAPAGPYALTLGLQSGRIRADIATADGTPAHGFTLDIAPLRQIIRDYRQICESYRDAVRRLPPARIEALDAGRREIHGEASSRLHDMLAPHAALDEATARRLFTLICALVPAEG